MSALVTPRSKTTAPRPATPRRPTATPPARHSCGRCGATCPRHGFLIGAVLCFAFFSWYPMVREFILRFQKNRRGTTTWVGWHNLHQIVHDPAFWQAWRNTVLFTGLALVLGFAVPFVVAIVLNEFRHARGYLRVLVYLPVMLPPVASLLLFKYFYDPGYGLFNQRAALPAPADLAVAPVHPHRHARPWSSSPPG